MSGAPTQATTSPSQSRPSSLAGTGLRPIHATFPRRGGPGPQGMPAAVIEGSARLRRHGAAALAKDSPRVGHRAHPGAKRVRRARAIRGALPGPHRSSLKPGRASPASAPERPGPMPATCAPSITDG